MYVEDKTVSTVAGKEQAFVTEFHTDFICMGNEGEAPAAQHGAVDETGLFTSLNIDYLD